MNNKEIEKQFNELPQTDKTTLQFIHEKINEVLDEAIGDEFLSYGESDDMVVNELNKKNKNSGYEYENGRIEGYNIKRQELIQLKKKYE